MRSLRSLFALVLALGLASAPTAQRAPECQVERGGDPGGTALERHQAAVRALPGRLDPTTCLPSWPPVSARLAVPTGEEASAEVVQAWDSDLASWTDIDRVLRATDADGRLRERIRQIPGADGWQNAEQTLFSTDASGEIQTDARWGEGWVPTRRASYFYRADQRSLGERHEIWDAADALWRIADQQTLAYDARGRLTHVLTETLDPASLQTVPVDQTRTSYSADGLETSILFQRWEAPASWISVSRLLLTADATGAPVSRLAEARQAGAWVPTDRTLYRLGAEVDTVRSQAWNVGSGVWEDSFQTLRTVTEAGARVVEITQSWTDDGWANVSRTESLVNASGRLIDYVVSVWEGDAWAFRRRLSRGYTDTALTEETAERWDGGAQAWRFVTKAAFAFTPSGARLRSTREGLAEDGTTRVSGDETNWAYDGADRVVSRTSTVWDPVAQAWVPSSRSLTTYPAGPVALAGGPSGRIRLRVVPNPILGTGRVQVASAVGAVATVEVVDVLGRRVARLFEGEMVGPVSLQLPTLAPGVYIVRVEAGSETLSRPMTVVR